MGFSMDGLASSLIPGYQPNISSVRPAKSPYSRKGTKRVSNNLEREIMGPNVYNPTLSPELQAAAGARIRSANDQSANNEIGNLSARMGGDVNGPLFNLLAGNIRGGAAARSGGALSDLLVQDIYRSQDLKQRKIGNLAQLLGIRSGTSAGYDRMGLEAQQFNVGTQKWQQERTDQQIADLIKGAAMAADA